MLGDFDIDGHMKEEFRLSSSLRPYVKRTSCLCSIKNSRDESRFLVSQSLSP